MRLSKASPKSLPRQFFAGAFVFVIVIQAIAAIWLSPSPAHAGAPASIERGEQELCEKTADGRTQSGNICNHIGFCVFCSTHGRSHVALDAPPLRIAVLILRLEEPEARPSVVFEERPVPLAEIGWKASWSATAPPRA